MKTIILAALAVAAFSVRSCAQEIAPGRLGPEIGSFVEALPASYQNDVGHFLAGEINAGDLRTSLQMIRTDAPLEEKASAALDAMIRPAVEIPAGQAMRLISALTIVSGSSHAAALPKDRRAAFARQASAIIAGAYRMLSEEKQRTLKITVSQMIKALGITPILDDTAGQISGTEIVHPTGLMPTDRSKEAEAKSPALVSGINLNGIHHEVTIESSLWTRIKYRLMKFWIQMHAPAIPPPSEQAAVSGWETFFKANKTGETNGFRPLQDGTILFGTRFTTYGLENARELLIELFPGLRQPRSNSSIRLPPFNDFIAAAERRTGFKLTYDKMGHHRVHFSDAEFLQYLAGGEYPFVEDHDLLLHLPRLAKLSPEDHTAEIEIARAALEDPKTTGLIQWDIATYLDFFAAYRPGSLKWTQTLRDWIISRLDQYNSQAANILRNASLHDRAKNWSYSQKF